MQDFCSCNNRYLFPSVVNTINVKKVDSGPYHVNS